MHVEGLNGDGVDLKRTKRVKDAPTSVIHLVPPNAPEHERGVIGCIMLSPMDVLSEVLMKIKSPDVFYDLRNQTVFKALLHLAEKNIPIDEISLLGQLKVENLLESVGGIEYVTTFANDVPSAANLSYYLDFVLEKYLLRKVLYTCNDVVSRVHGYEGEVDQLLDEVERDILAIGDMRSQLGVQHKTAKDLARMGLEIAEKLFLSNGAITGIQTGLIDLDKVTDGMHGGDLIILTGYPSTGKTSLVMNWVEYVAVDLKRPVGVLTLEMTPEQLMLRMQCARAKVNVRKLSRGIATDEDFRMMTWATNQIANAPLHIRMESGLGISQAKAIARRMKQQHGIELLVIDYMQRMHAKGSRKETNRAEELGMISTGCKNIAMELGIPVVLPSQLNDDGNIYGGREPGHDADTLIKLKNKGEWQPVVQPVEALIDKQRHGPAGEKIQLTFLKETTRFMCAAKESPGDDAEYTR